MKAFVAMIHVPWEQDDVVGVYSTANEARTAVEAARFKNPYGGASPETYLSVTEWDGDKELRCWQWYDAKEGWHPCEVFAWGS
jgi:hypothetical protein